MFGGYKFAQFALSHLIDLPIFGGDETDDLVGCPCHIHRGKYALIGCDTLALGCDRRDYQTIRVLVLGFLEAVQKCFGLLDFFLDFGDGGILGIGDRLGDITVSDLPTDGLAFLQFWEVICFLDAKFFKSLRSIVDVFLGSAVREDGRLVKERCGFTCCFGLGCRRFLHIAGGKGREQIRLRIASRCAGFRFLFDWNRFCRWSCRNSGIFLHRRRKHVYRCCGDFGVLGTSTKNGFDVQIVVDFIK